ncbi:mfs sugar transporter [Diplodia corticola]|uniref:Mfs sugar transporter n=1 Tax=Diplodia corticola TaxID=236234 RepID=A0A1J9R7T4_9PEZI|nr:mfs sugar transporter [Diplodia corticola]OJD36585.1 mfs sugar transporter [Diplodia corticola]
MVIASHADGAADPILQRMADEDKMPWYKKPNMRKLYFLLFPTCMGVEMTSGFDSQMINAVQLVDPWKEYFNYPTGSLKGIIAAIYSLGAICALPFIPLVNDRYGRRWCIFFGSSIMIVGAFLQGFSNGVGMYLVARFLLGVGIPFCIVAASSLMGELGYPKERPILTSMFNACWFVGSILAAGITFGTQQVPSDWAWRIPSLLQAVPSALQVSCIFLIPESPRFLISRDRHEEALAILVKYHAEGDARSEFAHAEMAEIQATLKIELEHSKQSWLDLARTAGMRKRVLICSLLGLFTQWSGNTLISYYLDDLLTLMGFRDPQFKGKLNVGLTCWQFVNGMAAAVVVKRFRRRAMYMACTLSLLCVYVGWTVSMERFLSTSSVGAARLTIFFIFLYSPAYNIGYNALTYTYLVELFPYAQRASGLSVFQFWGRGAGFFTTFVNPIGLEEIKWRWLLVYCCWIAFEIVVVYVLFPETSGRTLEELAFLFEDKQLADETTAAVEKQIHHEDMPTKDGKINHVETARAA